jgi:hypothetical protein
LSAIKQTNDVEEQKDVFLFFRLIAKEGRGKEKIEEEI